MRDERRCSSMTSCIDELLALMTCGLQLRSGDIELVVELTRNQNHRRVCRYYFVDHPIVFFSGFMKYLRQEFLMEFWASRSGAISSMLSIISTSKSVIILQYWYKINQILGNTASCIPVTSYQALRYSRNSRELLCMLALVRASSHHESLKGGYYDGLVVVAL